MTLYETVNIDAIAAGIKQDVVSTGRFSYSMPFLSVLTLDSEQELFEGDEFERCRGITESGHNKDKKRSINGIASTEEISRSGIFIDISGIDVRPFKKNPIVLASHYAQVFDLTPGVIGAVGLIAKRNNSLLFKHMVFDTDPLSEAWFQKIQKGFVRMVSIGIMPIKMEIEEKIVGKGKSQRTIQFLNISKSELLEISPTAIGANRGAFIDPRSLPPSKETEAIQARIDGLQKDVEEMQRMLDGSDEEHESFGDASFPDAAFIVEKGAPKEDGKTPQKFRHLPHHRASVGSPTENSSIDVPHLRNALARVNQVKPVSENASGYRARAERHLQAHAKAVLKSSLESIDALAEQEGANDTAERLVELAYRFASNS